MGKEGDLAEGRIILVPRGLKVLECSHVPGLRRSPDRIRARGAPRRISRTRHRRYGGGVKVHQSWCPFVIYFTCYHRSLTVEWLLSH
jgi:hypothetical protein